MCAHIKNYTVSISTNYFIQIICSASYNEILRRRGSFQKILSLHTWRVSISIQFKTLLLIYVYKLCLQFVHNHSNFLL